MLMPGSVHITKAEELQGPPRDAPVDVGDDAVEDEGEYDEQGFDGEDEDEEDEAEGEATETHPQKRTADGERNPAGEVDREPDAATTGNAKEAEAGDQSGNSKGSNSATGTPSLPLRPAPQPALPKRRPRPSRGRRLPHNGVSLRDAIVHKSGSLCASVLTVKPQCSTVVFHNGEQEAIVYAVAGTAVLATLPEDFDEVDEFDDTSSSSTARKPPATTTVSAGDFAFIPAWTEHQVRNEGSQGSADVVWVWVRTAGEPTVVPLQGWGGEQAG
jgi:uncharacterized RmlC-like cupin family protein